MEDIGCSMPYGGDLLLFARAVCPMVKTIYFSAHVVCFKPAGKVSYATHPSWIGTDSDLTGSELTRLIFKTLH